MAVDGLNENFEEMFNVGFIFKKSRVCIGDKRLSLSHFEKKC